MLDKQDIAILKGMFADAKIDMHDELKVLFAVSENKLITRMDRLAAELRTEIKDMRNEIVDLIDDSILPQIEALRQEDARIKKFVGMV
jgi:hypothetical protein